MADHTRTTFHPPLVKSIPTNLFFRHFYPKKGYILMTTTPFVPPTSYSEDRFFSFWHKQNIPYPLIRQYKIGPYYVDFAHLESHTIIEIDGAAYHTSPEQVQRDNHRQQRLESWGWSVIRFTGRQVFRDPVRTVYRAKRAVENNGYALRTR